MSDNYFQGLDLRSKNVANTPTALDMCKKFNAAKDDRTGFRVLKEYCVDAKVDDATTFSHVRKTNNKMLYLIGQDKGVTMRVHFKFSYNKENDFLSFGYWNRSKLYDLSMIFSLCFVFFVCLYTFFR
jgi:hypothetical protein